jgi:hypothetical protein
MIRSIIAALIMMTGAYSLSSFYVGYSHAGEQYVSAAREARKSLRQGSRTNFRTGGSGGFKSGK